MIWGLRDYWERVWDRGMKVLSWHGGWMAALVLFAGCAGPSEELQTSGFVRPNARAITKWRKTNGLEVASADEIVAAKRCAARFEGHHAVAVDGELRIVFHMGRLIGKGCVNLSTTSTYSLQDARGKELASGPSYIVAGLTEEERNPADRGVWFASDGKRVVVYEYPKCCHGPGPLTIVFAEDEGNPGTWSVRFVSLPKCGFASDDEGAHAECLGLAGDELLIDAGTGDGIICKKKIREFQNQYPFPFTIG